MEMAPMMLLNMEKDSISLLAEIFNTACYIRNRLVTRTCSENKSPFGIIHGRRTYVGHFKNSGSNAFIHTPTELGKDQFQAKSKRGSY